MNPFKSPTTTADAQPSAETGSRGRRVFARSITILYVLMSGTAGGALGFHCALALLPNEGEVIPIGVATAFVAIAVSTIAYMSRRRILVPVLWLAIAATGFAIAAYLYLDDRDAPNAYAIDFRSIFMYLSLYVSCFILATCVVGFLVRAMSRRANRPSDQAHHSG